ANGRREYFIHSTVAFDKSGLTKYDSGAVSLRVSGHVKWRDKTIDYCYKYYPWPSGDRPNGVPLFVPCDFEIGVNTTIEMRASMLETIAGFAGVKIEAPRPEHS